MSLLALVTMAIETVTAAKRVFVSVSTTSSYYNDAWEFPEKIIQNALNLVNQCHLVSTNREPKPLFLAKERSSRIHIVFDIFNDLYDSETAHLPKRNNLPVIAVFFSGKNGVDSRTAGAADKSLEERVNKEIQELHDWTGIGSQPPFISDHTNGNVPTYPHPRTLKKSMSKVLDDW